MTELRIQTWRLIFALLLLCHGALAFAQERFAIGRLDEQAMWVSVSGSASVTRLQDGILIKFDALRFSSRRHRDDSVFISSIRIAGGDGNTNLIYSERLPVGLTLRGVDSAVFENAQPIFMQYPDWHQAQPYYRLEIEVSADGGVVPVSTTLHELKLPSRLGDHATSPVREIPGAAQGWQFLLLGLLVFLVLRHAMRARHASRTEVLLAFLVFVWVWVFGCHLLWRGASSLFWTRVEAQLVDTGVKMTPPSNGIRSKFPREYRPVVKYVYNYQGRNFSSTQVSFAHLNGAPTLDPAYALQESWDKRRREQGRVEAWVNPLDPADAVLLRELPARSWLLSLAGFAALYFWMRRAATREAPPDLSNTLYGRLRAMKRR